MVNGTGGGSLPCTENILGIREGEQVSDEQKTISENFLNAVLWLIDAIQGVQDWKGTNVGDAIDAVEAQLVHRKTEVQQ